MANTGVVPSPELISEFENIQLKRLKAKYVIYKIENKTSIVTEKLSENADFEDFKNSMPADDCRFAVYDFDYTTHDGRPNNKLVFVSWSPENSPVRSKMLYAGSKDALTRVLLAVGVKCQATDFSELTSDLLLQSILKV